KATSRAMSMLSGRPLSCPPRSWGRGELGLRGQKVLSTEYSVLTKQRLSPDPSPPRDAGAKVAAMPAWRRPRIITNVPVRDLSSGARRPAARAGRCPCQATPGRGPATRTTGPLMSDQPTRAVQDYLKAIHSLGGAERQVFPVDTVARLQVKAPSVTGMLK